MTTRVNQNRLWDSLMDMAKIGATPKGGSSRLALTELDKAGRDLFVKWCVDLGMEIYRDSIGNLFATYPGKNRTLPPIVMGSHLDTQPKGGRFDGVYGVLGALEVIRTLVDAEIHLQHDLMIAVWTNEEGARFSPAMMGSEVFIGELSLEKALSIKDRDGISVKDSLEKIGEIGSAPLGQKFDSYFELHIEQGPLLEDLDREIGIVTGGQAIVWLDVSLEGRSQHAGTTPMRYRKDAMLGTAELLIKIEDYIKEIPDALLTVGEIGIPNSSRNTIAGDIKLTLDIRHPQTEMVQDIMLKIKELVKKTATERKLESHVTDIWLSPAIPFNPDCIDLVRESVSELDFTSLEMISGAGHDAIHLAKHCPTTMIFIACKDGISHNEAESITQHDAANGADVLLHTILKRDHQ